MAEGGDRRRIIRRNALMDFSTSTENLIVTATAYRNCRENYDEAYHCYDYGKEFFTYDTFDLDIQNARRVNHYESVAIEFHTITTNIEAIRIWTGHHYPVFDHICANEDVMASLRESKAGYFISPRSYARCPINEKVIIVIALNYLDNGCTFKNSTLMFKIPRVGYCVREGIKALCELANINLPTTVEEWVTSALGFEQMHGLPNVVASMDVTPVYAMSQNPIYKCPETGRHCLKVATVMDSSGKYIAYDIFNGSIRETENLLTWDFFHRLKATEELIGLPGGTRTGYLERYPTIGAYPARMSCPNVGGEAAALCATTAGGILVDGRYSFMNCALFMVPERAEMRVSVYAQRHFRTRFHTERQYGKLTQFFHLKMRQTQMEGAKHPMRNAIIASLMVMNVRNTVHNSEHACTR